VTAPRRVSLKMLERVLNSDSKARSAFLKDPARALRRAGVVLSADEVASVKSQIATMRLRRLLEYLPSD
jgi:hypothetical protein